MTTLKIYIEYKDGSRTIYQGEAEGFLDQVEMTLVEGSALPGYDYAEPNPLQFHAAFCRSAAWEMGLDTIENWIDPFDR